MQFVKIDLSGSAAVLGIGGASVVFNAAFGLPVYDLLFIPSEILLKIAFVAFQNIVNVVERGLCLILRIGKHVYVVFLNTVDRGN